MHLDTNANGKSADNYPITHELMEEEESLFWAVKDELANIGEELSKYEQNGEVPDFDSPELVELEKRLHDVLALRDLIKEVAVRRRENGRIQLNCIEKRTSEKRQVAGRQERFTEDLNE